MFFTILRQSLRMLTRQRLFSMIHVIGLAIGLAACAVIALFIREELSFETHLEKGDQLYRVIEVNPSGASGTVSLPYAVGSLAPALVEQFPEVEMAGRITSAFSWTVGFEGDPQNVDVMVAVDPQIIDLFELEFIEGDAGSALSSPDRIAINRSTAERFFGDEKALGKVLIFDGKRPMTVAGVFENMTENTHLYFEVLIPYVVFSSDPAWAWLDTWYTSTFTYVRLKPGVDPTSLDDRFTPLIQSLLPDQPGMMMKLQPVRDIHLKSENIMWDYAFKKSSESSVILFSVIGVGILLLACVNFMNLATSRALTRAREVGLRKVVGASKGNLIRHFLVEAVLIAIASLPLALLLVELILPTIRTLVDRSLPDVFLAPGVPLLVLLAFTILAGLLAGSYPAFVLSSFKPVKILRGNSASASGKSTLRRILVTSQLVLSILLLLVSGMVVSQIRFMQRQPLGFQKDHVVVARVADESERWDRIPLRDEVAADPGVISASLSQVVPGRITAEDYVVPDGWTGDPITMNMNIVCEDFIDNMGLKVVAGRGFDPARPSDDKAIVINEAAMRAFGWDDFQGRSIRGGSGRIFPVLGVIKDYHFMSMHHPVEPQMLIYYPARGEHLCFRVKAEGMQETIARVATIWQKYAPHKPFEYHFLDESINQWYASEEKTAQLLTLFSGLALLITCLGLLGLSGHSAERRKPEIGIRKVLGASSGQMLAMVLKESLVLVILANVISWPIAIWIGRAWAQNFAFRAPIAWWMLPAAAVVTLAVVVLVTSAIAWRAANLNPAEVIRED